MNGENFANKDGQTPLSQYESAVGAACAVSMKKTLLSLVMVGAWAVNLASAAVLTSADGRSRDFPVVVAASPQGLIVRDTPNGRDIVIAWEKLDVAKSIAANPWLEEAHRKVKAGARVPLNVTAPPPLREAKLVLNGTAEDNFTRLTLAARVPQASTPPQLAVISLGTPAEWAARPDATAWAQQEEAALVTVTVEGTQWSDSTGGSGAALLKGVSQLLRGPDADPASPSAPALILIGQGTTSSAFVWNFLCHRPERVLAAATIDGLHEAQPTADVFATPVCFLQTSALTASPTSNPARPFDLWRQFSTDGCRWCFAAQPADPLGTALAFGRAVAAASPYREVIAQWEEYENPKRKDTLPLPVRTIKDWNEEPFRLAGLGGKPIYPVASRQGAARQELIWLPSEAFATWLAPAAAQ